MAGDGDKEANGSPSGEDNTSGDEAEAKAQVVKVRKLKDDDWVKTIPEEDLRWFKSHAKSVEELEDLKVQCTACWDQVNHKLEGIVIRHPVLNVPICKACNKLYHSGVWRRDAEGFFEHCRWCANGGELLCCSTSGCANVFCKRCIKRNLGRNAVSSIENDDEWKCLTCDDKQIRDARCMFYAIYQYWLRERAKLEKREAAKKEKEKRNHDLVTKMLNDSFDVLVISKRYLEDEQKKWRVRRPRLEDDPAQLQAQSVAVAAKLRKIIAISRKNLDVLDGNIATAVSEAFPAVDVSSLKTEVELPENGGTIQFSQEAEEVEDKALVNGTHTPKQQRPKAVNDDKDKKTDVQVTSSPVKSEPLDTSNCDMFDMSSSNLDGGQSSHEESSVPNQERKKDEPPAEMSKAEYAKVKLSVLVSSTSGTDDEASKPPQSNAAGRKKQLKSRKQLDRIRRASGCGEEEKEDEEEEEAEEEQAAEEAEDDGSSDNLGLGTESTDSEAAVAEEDFKPKQERKRSMGPKSMSTDAKLRRRFDFLVRKINRDTDTKLNGKAQVSVVRFSSKLESELASSSAVNAKSFPELKPALQKQAKKNINHDAEIDRLCNLSALEKAAKKKNANSEDEDESDAAESESPEKSKRGGRRTGKAGDKANLASISSDEDDRDEAASDDDLKTNVSAAGGAKAGKKLSANDIAKAAVLASSSSDEEAVVPAAEAKGKKGKGAAGPKSKKEEGEDEKASRSRKKREADPKFMSTKLSETDSSEAEEKSRKRREKRAKAAESDGEAEDMSPKKGKGAKRKRNAIVSDSDFEAEEEGENDNDDEAVADEDEEEEENGESDEESKPKKKGRRKRKKKGSSDDDSPELSDDEPRDKKKRKRIKKNSDSEDGDGGDDDDDKDSPSKGRKDIRKIIKDKKLSSTTKEAAVEERERRKRIEDRQKLYNERFEVKEGEIMNEVVLDFNAETKEVLVEVDKRLVKKMKPHQAKGVKFMFDAVFESSKDIKAGRVPGGCILAHCMGLGKTLQTIALVHTVHTNFPDHIPRVLVLCPVNTVKNWVDEFDKWLKGPLEVEVHDISREKDNYGRADRLNWWQREGGVMIMGYDMFRNLSNEKTKKFKKKQRDTYQQTLVDPGPDLVVCDEGHVLKNLKSALNIAMNRIKTKRRIILTGTPLQNNLSEYFAMVNFVKPSLLGTFLEFKNRFVNPIQNGQHSDSTERDVRVMKKRSFILNDLLKGCMQRLDYNVLVPFLQPKHEYVLCINLTDFQKKLYKHYLENYARAGQIGSEGKLEGGKKGGLFYDVQNLSRVWNHPFILLRAKERADMQKLFEDDKEELEDFICDGTDESDARSTSEGSNSDAEELLEETTTRKSTRSQKDVELIDLDQVKSDALASDKGWWDQFLEEDGRDLEDLELGSKMVLLMEILKECELTGDKVLVFSQSLLSLDLIEAFLARANEANASKHDESSSLVSYLGSWRQGVDYFRMDGSTNPDQRKKWCDYFNKADNHQMRLFLISTKAGGLGINLVAANRVIIFDASWNPAHDVQSIFRVYRFGQTKPVYIYRFLAKGTMEEKIYDRQVAKQSLSARVVDEHQIERHFSMSELAELYEYIDEPMDQRPTPKVPKDLLLAELLKKHENLIWKFHDHDSLLENQVDENLTEEERKAAWEEFENEKKGIVYNNPEIRNVMMSNINPVLIQEEYRRQYPHLTDEQVQQATRAYMMQLQSPYHGRPAYDKSLYNQEMQRARQQTAAMYPGMYRQAQAQSSSTAMSQLQQAYDSGSNSSSSADWARARREQETANIMEQIKAMQRQQQQQQQSQQQRQTAQQAYQQQQLLLQEMLRLQRLQQQQPQAQQSPVRTGRSQIPTVDLTTSPSSSTSAAQSPRASRRGRPPLDPTSDDPNSRTAEQ